MRKEIAQQLKSEAVLFAERFNNPQREMYSGETFEVDEIIPLSEYAAAVIYEKSSGKKALAGAFHIKTFWFFFFLKESHIYGMNKFEGVLHDMERHNYEFNFEDEQRGDLV